MLKCQCRGEPEDRAKEYKDRVLGTSLVVQRLRLHAPHAGGQGSNPGPETGSNKPQ